MLPNHPRGPSRWTLGLVAVALLATACSGGGGASPTGSASPSGSASPTRPALTWDYQKSTLVRFPEDLPTTPAAPSCPDLPESWLADEKAKAGTDPWPYPVDSNYSGPVDLYAEQPSVYCGQTLRLRLGDEGGSAVVKVYRVGDYQGKTARLVWTSAPVGVTPRQEPTRAQRNIEDFRWPTRLDVPIGADWPPGLYVAVAVAGGKPSGLNGFVVRRPQRLPSVVQHADATWAAYNGSGGASFYGGVNWYGSPPLRPDGGKASFQHRAYTVTMRRPLMGAGRLALLTFDMPTARLMDMVGVPADHVLDSDVDEAPSLLRDRTFVALPGHPEYQTTRNYDALLAARNSGANVAVFGANDIYWETRFDRGADGRLLSVTSYKGKPVDPHTEQDPFNPLILYTDPAVNRDESALMGQSFAAAGVVGSFQVQPNTPEWILENTGLKPGDWIAKVVGNEANTGIPQRPAAPPNVNVFLATMLRRPGTAERIPVSAAIYKDVASGAGVFNAGSTTWACAAVGGPCLFQLTPDARAQAQIYQMTANIVRAFTSGNRIPDTEQSVPDGPQLDRDTGRRLGYYGASTADIEEFAQNPSNFTDD